MSSGWYPYDRFVPGDGDDISDEDTDLTGLNADEIIQKLQLDERADAPLISPVNYAKIRPISPQLIYYAIRNKKIKTYTCNCGEKRINKNEADKYYREARGEQAWPYGEDEEDDDDE